MDVNCIEEVAFAISQYSMCTHSAHSSNTK